MLIVFLIMLYYLLRIEASKDPRERTTFEDIFIIIGYLLLPVFWLFKGLFWLVKHLIAPFQTQPGSQVISATSRHIPVSVPATRVHRPKPHRVISMKRFDTADAQKFEHLRKNAFRVKSRPSQSTPQKNLIAQALNLAKDQPNNTSTCDDIISSALDSHFCDLAVQALLAADARADGELYCDMVERLYGESDCRPFVTPALTHKVIANLLAMRGHRDIPDSQYGGPSRALSAVAAHLFLCGQVRDAFRVFNVVPRTEAVDRSLDFLCREIARCAPDQTDLALLLAEHIADPNTRARALIGIAQACESENEDAHEPLIRITGAPVYHHLEDTEEEPIDDDEDLDESDFPEEPDPEDADDETPISYHPDLAEAPIRELSAGVPAAELRLDLLPDRPGLYAVYAADRQYLPEILRDQVDLNQPLYIGKAGENLKTRLSQTHFQSRRSSFSTLRRTLIALYYEEEIDHMQILPGGKSGIDFIHYQANDDWEDMLSMYMLLGLRLRWWVCKTNMLPHLKQIEQQVIQHCNPPLNLQHSDHPLVPEVKTRRKKCAALAQKHR